MNSRDKYGWRKFSARSGDIYVGGKGPVPLENVGPFASGAKMRGVAASVRDRKVGGRLTLAVGGALALALSVWLAMSVASCVQDDTGAELAGTGEVPPGESPALPTVSFVAVGDNLPDKTLAVYADGLAGEVGDGAYDYRPVYAPVRSYIEGADLAFISEEVHLGGDDLGPQGYPSFNAPDDLADALVETGFDLVASASNHCYDWGNYGALEHSRELWNTKPVAFAGTATSPEEDDAIPVVEREGITFAFLDYTYGLNGFERDEVPAYAVSFLDEDRIRAQVSQARDLADVVIAAVHWGTEKKMEPDEQQLAYAQVFADAGVDIVLGSHPHVIGPVEWVEGADGHKTLVAYALGDFKSTHSTPHLESELSGMLACDFVRKPAPDSAASAAGGSVSIENVRWIPLVNHIENGAHAVYALKDYSDDAAARHVFLNTQDNPLQWMRETTERVVNSRGAGIPIQD